MLASAIAGLTDGSVWVFLIVVIKKKSQVRGKCKKAVIVVTVTKPWSGGVLKAWGIVAVPQHFGSSFFLQSSI